MLALHLAIRICLILAVLSSVSVIDAQDEWEVTGAGEASLASGLEWLARNQGPQGNWESNDSVSSEGCALAFLADGHLLGGESTETLSNVHSTT